MRVRQLLALLSVPMVLFLERLTYYGCRSVLLLFLTQPETSGGLGMSTSAASGLYASFTLALALVPVLGGVVGFTLGPRAALPVGLALDALGFGLLAVAKPGPDLMLALGVLVLGQALFRPNLFAVLGQELPDPDGNLRGAGMMLSYGAINLGALVASMVFGALARGRGFGITFATITLVAGFTLLLVGGLSVPGIRRPPAPATSAPMGVPGILAVTALLTLPYLTVMLGTEALYNVQTLATGPHVEYAVVLFNAWTVILAAGLLFGVLVVLHIAKRPLPALWLLGGGAVLAALSVSPLVLGGTGPGEPSLVAAVIVGGLAELLVTAATLSRASAGPSSRVVALLLGVLLSWMGVLNQGVDALSKSGSATLFLAPLALGSLVVGGALLFSGRRLEQRLFAPASAPTTPAPDVFPVR